MVLLLVTLALANLALAAPGAVCSQNPYKNFLPLSKNCFVQSYCSSAYPVPPVTSTKATITSTITATASTTQTVTTTTSPTITVLSTLSQTSTTTLSLTETDTETDTATTTTTSAVLSVSYSTSTIVTNANGATFKRDAAAAPVITPAVEIEGRAAQRAHGFASNTRALSASSAWGSWAQSLTGYKSTISTACSCIETPKTITTTKTTSVTTTSTTTLSSTATVTSPVTTTSVVTSVQDVTALKTVTTTTTTTQTLTQTAVTTSTSTSTAFYNACGQNFAGPVSGAPIGARCGSNISGSYSLLSSNVVASYQDCLVAADANYASTSFTFQFSTRTCNIYSNSGSTSQYTSDADWVYSYFYP